MRKLRAELGVADAGARGRRGPAADRRLAGHGRSPRIDPLPEPLALVLAFVLFAILDPPLGVIVLAVGAVIEVGEAVFWTRYLSASGSGPAPRG